MAHRYTEGEKVIFNGDTYDFGYYSATPGYVVLYEEGERNMQDSFAILEDKIHPKAAPWLEKQKVLNVETQIIDSPEAASYYGLALKLAKEAGYTHVHDHWGVGGYDEFTIDEAINNYENANKQKQDADDDLPF